MRKNSKLFSDILIRYLILLVVAIPSLWIFYAIFTPLTTYPVFYILDLLFDASLKGNVIHIMDKFSIEIIGACVAGSAYYLLLILSLSIQKIKLKTRLKIIASSFLIFLIINILRIVALSAIYVYQFSWFDVAHQLFWYVGSIIIVLLIWFAEIKWYKIKDIPFYSDLKFLYKQLKN